jgi:hypothetical protein
MKMAAKVTTELSSRIKNCSSKEQIDSEFEKLHMSNEDRVDSLIEIMGDPIVFYSCENPNPEQQYRSLIGSFLSGIWKPDFSSFKQ